MSFTVSEVVALVGVPPHAVRKLVDSLSPPVPRINGARVIPADRIEEIKAAVAGLERRKPFTAAKVILPDDEHFTVPVVAKMLGVDDARVIEWCRSGALKGAINLSFSSRPRYRINRRDLNAFLESRRVVPPAAPQRRRRKVATAREFY